MFTFLPCLVRYMSCLKKGDHILDTSRWLLHVPLPFVTKHNGYDINGFHFVTQDRDLNQVTQK